RVQDKYVLAITLFSIGLTAIYFYGMPKIIEGFEPGFELIIINGGISFVLLWANSIFTPQHTNEP
ncbi:MAG: hypothetical protein P8N47_06155, partial [Bacteroidia bacterium]|nr:hypothetical protein [Bacteroidia bacterium]